MKIQTNWLFKIFFLDLLDAKISKTSSNESFLDVIFKFSIVDIITNVLNLYSLCIDLSRFLIKANFENYFKWIIWMYL